jgi:hypothetical protein
MNILCLGGKVIGSSLAIELVNGFLAARFSGLPRRPPLAFESSGVGECAFQSFIGIIIPYQPDAQV